MRMLEQGLLCCLLHMLLALLKPLRESTNYHHQYQLSVPFYYLVKFKFVELFCFIVSYNGITPKNSHSFRCGCSQTGIMYHRI